MHDRLLPFLAQLKDDKIPAAGIVRMANGGKGKDLPPISIDDVNAARAELAAGSADATPAEPEAPAAEPEAPPPDAEPEVAPEVKPSEPEPEPAPSHVRVVMVGHRTFPRGPKGFPFLISYRGVFAGAEAAWLWENHRALVEPLKPKG